jgi:hypothetical protein
MTPTEAHLDRADYIYAHGGDAPPPKPTEEDERKAALCFVRLLAADPELTPEEGQGSVDDILAKPGLWAAEYKHAMGVVARIGEIESAAIKRGREAECKAVVAFFRNGGNQVQKAYADAIEAGAHLDPPQKGAPE